MTRRAVILGDGRAVPLVAYVAAWRAMLAASEDCRFRGSPKDPRGWKGSYTRAEVLREFRDGLHDRINRHIPNHGKGRKWSYDWFMAAWRLSRDVNTPRLIVRYCPAEFRPRLEHRLTVD